MKGTRMRRSLSICQEPGCPELTDRARCGAHRRAVEKTRGTRAQRGYDRDYDRRRRRDLRALRNGVVLTCWRCSGVILPHDYSLGHCDDDRSVLHGPEHLRKCNLANTRGGCPHPSHEEPAMLICEECGNDEACEGLTLCSDCLDGA